MYVLGTQSDDLSTIHHPTQGETPFSCRKAIVLFYFIYYNACDKSKTL